MQRKILMFLIILLFSLTSASFAQEPSAQEYWKQFMDRLDTIETIYFRKIVKIVIEDNNEMADQQSSASVWWTGKKYKMESNMNSESGWNAILIVRPEGNFMKETGSDIFKYIGRPELPSLRDLLISMFPGGEEENATFKCLGKETIDNEEITVIERTTPYAKTSYIDTYWISDKRKLPVKHTNRWAHSKGMYTVIEFKDYGFDSISDSLFDVGDDWVDEGR